MLPTHMHSLYQRIKMFDVLLGSHIGKWQSFYLQWNFAYIIFLNNTKLYLFYSDLKCRTMQYYNFFFL